MFGGPPMFGGGMGGLGIFCGGCICDDGGIGGSGGGGGFCWFIMLFPMGGICGMFIGGGC